MIEVKIKMNYENLLGECYVIIEINGEYEVRGTIEDLNDMKLSEVWKKANSFERGLNNDNT